MGAEQSAQGKQNSEGFFPGCNQHEPYGATNLSIVQVKQTKKLSYTVSAGQEDDNDDNYDAIISLPRASVYNKDYRDTELILGVPAMVQAPQFDHPNARNFLNDRFREELIPVTNCILKDSEITDLRSLLPITERFATHWVLRFSPGVHGISMDTLYRQTKEVESLMLIIIETACGEVFGGLAEMVDRTQFGRYYGDHNSFVFHRQKKSDTEEESGTELNYYHWSMKDRFFQYSDNSGIGMGGGSSLGKGFAWWIRSDFLRGQSMPSETFENPQFTEDTDFVVNRMEIWSMESVLPQSRLTVLSEPDRVPSSPVALIPAYSSQSSRPCSPVSKGSHSSPITSFTQKNELNSTQKHSDVNPADLPRPKTRNSKSSKVTFHSKDEFDLFATELDPTAPQLNLNSGIAKITPGTPKTFQSRFSADRSPKFNRTSFTMEDEDIDENIAYEPFSPKHVANMVVSFAKTLTGRHDMVTEGRNESPVTDFKRTKTDSHVYNYDERLRDRNVFSEIAEAFYGLESDPIHEEDSPFSILTYKSTSMPQEGLFDRNTHAACDPVSPGCRILSDSSPGHRLRELQQKSDDREKNSVSFPDVPQRESKEDDALNGNMSSRQSIGRILLVHQFPNMATITSEGAHTESMEQTENRQSTQFTATRPSVQSSSLQQMIEGRNSVQTITRILSRNSSLELDSKEEFCERKKSVPVSPTDVNLVEKTSIPTLSQNENLLDPNQEFEEETQPTEIPALPTLIDEEEVEESHHSQQSTPAYQPMIRTPSEMATITTGLTDLPPSTQYSRIARIGESELGSVVHTRILSNNQMNIDDNPSDLGSITLPVECGLISPNAHGCVPSFGQITARDVHSQQPQDVNSVRISSPTKLGSFDAWGTFTSQGSPVLGRGNFPPVVPLSTPLSPTHANFAPISDTTECDSILPDSASISSHGNPSSVTTQSPRTPSGSNQDHDSHIGEAPIRIPSESMIESARGRTVSHLIELIPSGSASPQESPRSLPVPANADSKKKGKGKNSTTSRPVGPKKKLVQSHRDREQSHGTGKNREKPPSLRVLEDKHDPNIVLKHSSREFQSYDSQHARETIEVRESIRSNLKQLSQRSSKKNKESIIRNSDKIKDIISECSSKENKESIRHSEKIKDIISECSSKENKESIRNSEKIKDILSECSSKENKESIRNSDKIKDILSECSSKENKESIRNSEKIKDIISENKESIRNSDKIKDIISECSSKENKESIRHSEKIKDIISECSSKENKESIRNSEKIKDILSECSSKENKESIRNSDKNIIKSERLSKNSIISSVRSSKENDNLPLSLPTMENNVSFEVDRLNSSPTANGGPGNICVQGNSPKTRRRNRNKNSGRSPKKKGGEAFNAINAKENTKPEQA